MEKEFLRKKAQEIIKNKGAMDSSLYSKNLEELVEELQIYQVELEHQNEELRNVSNELEAAATKYNELYNAAPAGYISIDSDFTIIEVNQTFCQLIGLTSNQMNGMNFSKIVAPNSQDDFYLLINTTLKEHRSKKEDIILRNKLSHNEIYAKLITFPETIERESNKIIKINVIDISKEKAFENQLRLEHTRWSKTFANVKDSILVIDSDHNILQTNAAFTSLINTPTTNIIGNKTYRLIHGSDRPEEKCPACIAYVTKTSSEKEFFEPHLSKHLLMRAEPVHDMNGLFEYVVITISDITSRENARKEIENAKNLFESVANTAAPIWMSGTNKKCIWFNDPWLKFTGRSMEEELGNGWAENVHPDDMGQCLKIYTDAFEKRKSFTMEYRLKRYDGEYRWVLDQGSPRYDSSGKFLGYIGSCMDVHQQKEIQEEIKRANEILSFSPVATFSWKNEESWPVAFVSKNIENILGYSSSDFLNDKINYREIIHPDDFPRVVDEVVANKTKENFRHLPYRLRRRDGDYIWVDDFTKIIREKNEIVRFEGIISDITEKQEAEIAIAESEYKYRSLAESTEAILWEFDIVQDKWSYVAPQVKRILGYDPKEWTNMQFWTNHIHPEDQEWATKYCMDCTQRGEAHTFEYRLRKKDGSYAWIRDVVSVKMADNKPIGLSGFMIEITESKIAEQKISASEKKYRNLVKTLNEGIWAIDKEGYTTFANEKMAEMLGYSFEEMEGKHLFDFMDEDGIKIAKENLERRENGISEQHDFEFCTKDGRKIYAQLGTSPQFNENGEYEGALAAVIDITEKRKNKLQLIHNRKNLARAEDIAKIGYWELDSNKNIFTFSENGAKIFGFKKLRVTLEQCFERIHDDSIDAVKVLIDEVASKKKSISIEYKINVNDETKDLYVIADYNTDDQTVFGVIQDITEAKQAESQLKFQAELLEQIEDKIVATDLDGKILYINKASALSLHQKPEDLIGKTVHDFGENPEKGSTQKEIIKKTLKHGKWHGYAANYAKDGMESILEVRTWVLKDNNGKPTGMVGVSTDVTNRIKTENELKEKNEEYIALNEEYAAQNEELRSTVEELVAKNKIIEHNQKEIVRSETMLKATLDSSTQTFVLLDEKREVLLCNNLMQLRTKQFFGKPIKVGYSMDNFVFEREYEDYISGFQKALSGEVISKERTIKHKGERIMMLTNL